MLKTDIWKTGLKKGIEILVLSLTLSATAQSEIVAGEKKVFLETPSGESLQIGSVVLSGEPNAMNIAFTIDDSKFSDQFLSMRPFKCIDGKPMVCRLEYSYPKKNQVSASDFADLEYDLLFITRSPTDYGIDPFNGRYYIITENNGKLIGEIRGVDLNILAAPPAEGDLRPITEADLDPLELENERFPVLRIE